jgi:deoxyadenosine/deoxycytidine kinase
MLISVEGNIGAGKSTLVRILQENISGIEFVQEPIELWKNCGGFNMLEAYYTNPKKYSYMFQTIVTASCVASQSAPQTTPIRVMERSAQSGMCFSKNCVETGLMDEMEFAAYQYWFNQMVTKKVDLYIYLRTDPEICFQRVCKRARSEEAKVGLDYLGQIHNQHETWFASEKGNFIIIDGNEEFESDHKNIVNIISKSLLSPPR